MAHKDLSPKTGEFTERNTAAVSPHRRSVRRKLRPLALGGPGVRKIRWTALLLVAAALSLPAVFSPVGAVGSFGDVEPDRYYTEAVQWMVDEGITTGTSASCFSPDRRVTRGQFAAFLYRMAGEPEVVEPSPFTDVVEPWQIDAVAWLSAQEITTGTTATTFTPDDPLSRGEIAALLHRRAGLPVAAPHPFDDVVASWQTDAVSWMHTSGITTGTSATTFSPDLQLTRAQIAVFLHRDAGAPEVKLDSADPHCDSGSAVREVAPTDFGIMASTGSVVLLFPSSAVEVVGYHQSGHDGSQQLESADHDVPTMTLESRRRGTGSRTAVDIVTDPGAPILSPVTGTVIRAGSYQLYCEDRDEFVVIEPDSAHGWEVKMLHFQRPAVEVGDRVIAGETAIGTNATILPFVSQIDKFTASPSWPHVHVEVVDPSIPDRPSGGC